MRLSLYLASLFLSQLLSAQGKFFGGNGDGFATATTTNITLPVNIQNFTVYKKGQGNIAELFLLYGDAICSLQLQRSIDGNNFSNIDLLQRSDFTGTSNHFVFTDPAPANGVNYYRIRINRCDATFLYSSIVSVKSGSLNNHLYYSALENTIQYSIAENGVLKLANTSGQIIYNKMLIAGSGLLSLEPLSKGVYFMQFGRDTPVKIAVQR